MHFTKEEVIYLRETQWPVNHTNPQYPVTPAKDLRKARHFAFWFAVNELEKEGNERLLVDCTRLSHALKRS